MSKKMRKREFAVSWCSEKWSSETIEKNGASLRNQMSGIINKLNCKRDV